MGDREDEQDRMLPIANVGRIMRQILGPSAKISKEAKQTMQECSTEFISFVTSEASDRCRKENRRTINGDDICWALSALGFDNYAQTMLRYLYRYREGERSEKANNQEDKDEEEHGIQDLLKSSWINWWWVHSWFGNALSKFFCVSYKKLNSVLSTVFQVHNLIFLSDMIKPSFC